VGVCVVGVFVFGVRTMIDDFTDDDLLEGLEND